MKELRFKFNRMIVELAERLKLKPIDENIKIKLKSENVPYKITKETIFDIGVIRRTKDHGIIIEVYSKYEDFFPFILLREAYYCFVPKELKDKDVIRICINQIVENDLKLSVSKANFQAWKDLIRNVIIDREIIFYQLDELERFFQLENTAPYEGIVQFFFIEIQKNARLFANRDIKDFYDFIFEHYVYKTFKALFKKDNVEALQAIIKIFYDKKKYLNLEDYYNYFLEYKKKKKLQTNLSLRKFKEKVRWIYKSTAIAPSYDINTTLYGVYPIICFITFNPLIEQYKIKRIISSIPFLTAPKISSNNFITHFEGVFYIPKDYVQDLIKFINKLETYGYIVKKDLLFPKRVFHFINLNYFLDFSNSFKVIDPTLKSYDKSNEFSIEKKYYYEQPPLPFSVLEFLILNRLQYFSITGLTFDKRLGTLNAIKSSIENESKKHLESCEHFRDRLITINHNKSLSLEFVNFLKENKKFGTTYIFEMLANILKVVSIIEKILESHSEITNLSQLRNYMKKFYVSLDIMDNIILQDRKLNEIIFKNLYSKYFSSLKVYKEEVQKIQLFHGIIYACYKLLIFNVNEIIQVVENLNEIERIYEIKKQRIKKNFTPQMTREITIEKIEAIIEKFLNNKSTIIKPQLINTILTSPYAKYFFYVILENISLTDQRFTQLKSYFPRVIIGEAEDIFTKKKITYISAYLVNIKEKNLFISALKNLFEESLPILRRYMWRGNIRFIGLELRDIFEFHKGIFLYKEGLFEQVFLYVQQIFGEKINNIFVQDQISNISLFWPSHISMNDVVNSVNDRLYYEKVEFNLDKLNELLEFRNNLRSLLLDIDKFKKNKERDFFKTYIDSIGFIPRLEMYGLAQYELIIGPTDYDIIDLKLLLSNSFQEINYPASIDPYQVINIKYIFPYRNPNKTYLNWLVGSKKCIREYCLFHKKKIYSFIDFSRNLSKEGWDYSSIIFEQYAQNVLFNPSYHPKLPFMQEFIIDQGSQSQIFGPNSKEFKQLCKIYNRSCIDIKSYLGTKKAETIKKITSLIDKDLIFPTLFLKNLDFRDKVILFLPDIAKDLNKKIIMIFSFFNLCNIYEIEGEFFIYGFDNEKYFENGFLIEIWFPHCELDEFFDVFDRIFEYLKVKHYMVLTDMVEGEPFLKSVYGNLNFLKEYSPLKNLKWNSQDNKWMNIKLFTEKFDPIYPDLIPKNDD